MYLGVYQESYFYSAQQKSESNVEIALDIFTPHVTWEGLPEDSGRVPF